MKDRLHRHGCFGIILFCIFLFSQLFFPAPTEADPTIPGFYGAISADLLPPSVNALPELNHVVQGAAVSDPINNRLDIHQNRNRAILEWDSFNIGRYATVNFDQQGNASWSALNLINDGSPSLIFGKLTADGRVFLINSNGIMFGPDSTINVHSLVASSLNIDTEDFLDNNLYFHGDDTCGPVSNHGTITTDTLGSVFLLGPQVENSGTIIAPYGEVELAAGIDMQARYPGDTRNYPNGWYVHVKDTGEKGEAVNYTGASIITDSGYTGMYGRVVNQDGLIRSVCAVEQMGTIRLLASDKVATGKESLTICPISGSDEKFHESFSFNGGKIVIDGLDSVVKSEVVPESQKRPLSLIEHQGIISAPTGFVSMKASERVFLGCTSIIDVSGVWAAEPSDALLIEAQLNSVQLRDDYNQKNGILLGEYVTFNAMKGTSIGEVSASLKSEELTAREFATQGGEVVIESVRDIVAMEGSQIVFAGGGYNFSEGQCTTTKLVSGTRVFDISSAPESVTYDGILGYYEKEYTNFGITEKYEGIFYGGANALTDYSPPFTQGSDAGILTLCAEQIVFQGSLDGSAVPGYFQTAEDEPEDAYGFQTALGWKEPKAGSLYIGSQVRYTTGFDDIALIDRVLGDVVVTRDPYNLSDSFGSDPARYPLPEEMGGTTYLDAGIINNASLENVYIYTNTSLKTQPDASVVLDSGGSFTVWARSIEHYGAITVPSGEVYLSLDESLTEMENDSRFVALEETLFLAPGSSISTAGRRIDNSFAALSGSSVINSRHIEGGSISLLDHTYIEPDKSGSGIVIADGASVDVSGGYIIDDQGGVTGGDAGTLAIQASTIILEGDVKGYSIPGSDGGTISLHAETVKVAKKAPELPEDFTFGDRVPVDMLNKFVLAEDRLDETGFSHIRIKSYKDLVFEDGTELDPSYVKLGTPRPGVGGSIVDVEANSLIVSEDLQAFSGEDLCRVMPEYTEDSSIEAYAGKSYDAFTYPPDKPTSNTEQLSVSADAVVRVAPEGRVVLKAPNILMAGSIDAPSGSVDLTATTLDVEGADIGLVIAETGRIDATGFIRMDTGSGVAGMEAGYTLMPGGDVALTSENADLIIKEGSIIDVSGSDTAEYLLQNPDGTFSSVDIASDPGSLSMTFFSDLVLDGEIDGHARLEGVRGGTLAVSRYIKDPAFHAQKVLAVSSGDLERYLESGFDDITLASTVPLQFTGSIDCTIARGLTIDAPVIMGAFDEGIDQYVSFTAPEIQVQNTYYPSGIEVTSGDAELSLCGTWLDVEGDVKITGFDDVTLSSGHDLGLRDYLYTDPDPNKSTKCWSGMIEVPGDIILKADRIYPTTMSDFSVIAQGTITTNRTQEHQENAIISAGGSLLLRADDIDHNGYLAAPLGRLDLYATDRLYLSADSVTSSTSDAAVPYGELGEIFWTMIDKDNPNASSKDEPPHVESAPEKTITISSAQGGEVIVRDGAVIDASGGGKIFSYAFMAGIEGSADPLKKENRYVIVEGTELPGEAVYIEDNGIIPEGMYTILPEEYAFVEGAYIIEDLGALTVSKAPELTSEGYRVVLGYEAVAGTGIISHSPHAYSIRSASDVLGEGEFNYAEIVAGNAGSIAITGTTTVIDGIIQARALSGYAGGTLGISAAESAVVASSLALAEDFSFDDIVPEDILDRCLIASEALNDKGLGRINIGDFEVTDTVTIKDGGFLSAPVVTLCAKQSIVLEDGSSIDAAGDYGTALLCSLGEISIESGAGVYGSREVGIYTEYLDNRGTVSSDGGKLTLVSDTVHVVDSAFEQNGVQGDLPGIYLKEDLQGFTGFDSIELAGETGIVFSGDVDLTVNQDLTMDTRAMIHDHISGGSVNLVAGGIIRLFNSEPAVAYIDPVLPDTANISMSADAIEIGRGDVIFDGFGSIGMECPGDLTFSGRGSLKTADTGGMHADASLSITASRLITSYYLYDESTIDSYVMDEFGIDMTPEMYEDIDSYYESPEFLVDAGSRTLVVSSGAQVRSGNTVPGGSLGFTAKGIEFGGIIEAPSAYVSMEATGTDQVDSIILRDGSQILAYGSEYAPGGIVNLTSAHGAVVTGQGSLIDVSAGLQGDAGTIVITSPTQRAVLEGSLEGESQGGMGGSFYLDTLALDDFHNLNTHLAEGGFAGEISLRARSNNIAVAEGEEITAHVFELTADSGSITLDGSIDASGEEGGRVELNAYESVTLSATSSIDASAIGTGEDGGEVMLGSSSAGVYFEEGSTIDVSGGPGDGSTDAGEGGCVHVRALREAYESDVELAGAVTGASRVIAEAFAVYEDSSISSTDISQSGTYYTQALAFSNSASTIEEGLLNSLDLTGSAYDAFHLVPGIELYSQGTMSLSRDWDLTTWRFVGEPGILTLRSGGDLSIRGDIVDHPTPVYTMLQKDPSFDSWCINLVAGADLASADIMAVNRETGDLAIRNAMVYTESGDIRFASGGDTEISQAPSAALYMINSEFQYNLATYDGSITAAVGGDLALGSGRYDGIIQSATGDIDLSVEGGLTMANSSAVRTTGYCKFDYDFLIDMFSELYPNIDISSILNLEQQLQYMAPGLYFAYKDGGDVTLDVRGDISGVIDTRCWDEKHPNFKLWEANYTGDGNTAGIATMGGGDIRIAASGDFTGQAGTFGQKEVSSLEVYAGGDINGRFLVHDGDCDLHAMGNFGSLDEFTAIDGSLDTFCNQAIEAFDTRVSVSAQGDITLGTVVNPTVAGPGYTGDSAQILTYTEDTAVRLHAVTGDVSIAGQSGPYWSSLAINTNLQRIFPATLDICAGDDIVFGGDLFLSPSHTGTLSLSAGSDISGRCENSRGEESTASLIMNDISPETLYGQQTGLMVSEFLSIFRDYSEDLIHSRDDVPVSISAGGDISDLGLKLPKRMEIRAGGNIEDIFATGQNLDEDQVSLVRAGGDIVFSSRVKANLTQTGIWWSGPGYLTVQAGGDIDLGSTQGIIAGGRYIGERDSNMDLPEESCSLIVMAGLDREVTPSEVDTFFDEIRDAGVEYSEMLGHDEAAAAKIVTDARQEIIEPFFSQAEEEDTDTASGQGNGNLRIVRSKITTYSGSPITVIATGDINAGRSAFVTEDAKKTTGITTKFGGSINMYAGRDVNILESRTMTLCSGDITIWSDEGNINAGRGSKTIISASAPRMVQDEDGNTSLVFDPPAVGSGIRTLSYDPDGVNGPKEAPPAGDAYLFAPGGVIDAGEAGISAENLVIGAKEVKNVQNIEIGGVTVGVSLMPESTGNIAALSGAGNISEAAALSEEVADLGSQNLEGKEESLAGSFIPKWVKVLVIGFGDEDKENTTEK